MDAELTKSFPFSASYARGTRSIGVNFILSVTVAELDEAAENDLEDLVQRDLISKIHTRDLSGDVDFLKGVEITDGSLLRAFWTKLARPLERYGPRRLALQRDSRTVTTLQL